MSDKTVQKIDLKALFFAKELERKEITVPGLGTITIMEMSGVDRDAFDNFTTRDMSFDKKGKPVGEVNMQGGRALLTRLSVIDPETGAKVFSEADDAKLSSLSGRVLQAIYKEVQTLNKLGEENVAESEGN